MEEVEYTISECKYSNILCSFQLFFHFCSLFVLIFVRKSQNKAFFVEFSSIKTLLSSILGALMPTPLDN